MAVLLVYVTGFSIVAFFGLLFYFLSVRSRRGYTCPQCGEHLRTEHLAASHCNLCGAPLEPDGRD